MSLRKAVSRGYFDRRSGARVSFAGGLGFFRVAHCCRPPTSQAHSQSRGTRRGDQTWPVADAESARGHPGLSAHPTHAPAASARVYAGLPALSARPALARRPDAVICALRGSASTRRYGRAACLCSRPGSQHPCCTPSSVRACRRPTARWASTGWKRVQ